MSIKVHLCSSLGKYFILQTQAKNSKYTYTGQYFDTLKFMSALCADITEVALICREKTSKCSHNKETVSEPCPFTSFTRPDFVIALHISGSCFKNSRSYRGTTGEIDKTEIVQFCFFISNPRRTSTIQ